MLKLLEKLSIVRNFYKLRLGSYKVFPFYSRNYKTKRSIKLYLRKTGDLQLSLTSLKALKLLTPASHFILETSQGVLTHKEALSRNIGGRLLAVVL